MKSRMRENCTYGSVRGNKTKFSLNKYKFMKKGVVELVYSTNKVLSKIRKNIMVILTISIFLIQFIVPLSSYAGETNIGKDGLIKLNIKGTDRTVTKTTTIDEIKGWYKEEHIFETPSLYGGKAYSFYVGDKFDDYLYIETIADGRIFSYGSVDPSYKTNTYSFGEKYPYEERNSLYGCLLSDDGIITGGIYYNKDVYLKGNFTDIKNAYIEAFETDYCKANNIEKNEIGSEKDKGRQSETMVNISKHAILMYNGLIHYYNHDESFMEIDKDKNGNATFKTFEEFFDINNQFIEFGTSAFSYMVNKGYGTSYYNSLGAKSNCDLYYSNYYIFNPLQLAGMAKLQKNKDLSTRNIPVWTYNYKDKTLVGIAFNEDCFKTNAENIEYTSDELDKLEKGREYYNNAITELYKEDSIYKTNPILTPPENMVAGELVDSKKKGIVNYFNAIRAAAGLGTVKPVKEGYDIAQHLTTLLAYRFRYLGLGLTHLPEQPEGVSREYWERAVGWETSWGNSLSYASRSVSSDNMIYHINSLLFDNDGTYAYGHRRHLLHPGYSEFGYGITEFFAEVNLNGYQEYNYVCNGWPAPNGVTFLESLVTKKFDWTVAFDKSKYTVLNSTTAEIKCLNTGDVIKFDSETETTNKVYQNIVEGEEVSSFVNKVVMYDTSIDPMAGYVYQVTIKGLENVRTGKIEDYTYRIRFEYADIAKYGSIPEITKIEPDAKLEQISDTNYRGKVGETYKLNAIIDDLNALNKKITWTSSNPELVSVKQDGTIQINKENNNESATITAFLDANQSIQKSITIQPKNVSIIIDNDKIKNGRYTFNNLNDTLQISAHLSNGEKTTFTYKSSNESILKVDQNGKVTPIAGGFANITVTESKYGKIAGCRCYVQVPVTLSDGSKAYVGDMDKNGFFNAVDSSMILDAFNNGASADQYLLGDVNGDGIVNAVDSSLMNDLYVTGEFSPGRYYKITGVTLNKTETTIKKGNTETLKATINPINTTDSPKITWSSSNTNIANVDSNGKVTAKSKGTTTITATTTNGKVATCKVTVNSDTPSVKYRTHVQKEGWQNFVEDGATSGTTGKSLRLEGIKIELDSPISGNVEYRTHVQNEGWQDWKKNGELSGTTGKSLRLEAIQMRLTGEIANQYDIYYRVHAQDFGWMGWTKNGEQAGTQGYGYRLEGIQIKLVKKGENGPTSSVLAFSKNLTVSYSTHVQKEGWQKAVGMGRTSGTTGKGLRLEGIKINLNTNGMSGGIRYSTHIQNEGWQSWKTNGEISGTTGKNLRMEAIKIELTGKVEEQYDIYYRVHAQSFGWMGWAKNGEQAGTQGYSYRLEAIEIRIVKKGAKAPGTTQNAFAKKN